MIILAENVLKEKGIKMLNNLFKGDTVRALDAEEIYKHVHPSTRYRVIEVTDRLITLYKLNMSQKNEFGMKKYIMGDPSSVLHYSLKDAQKSIRKIDA